MLNIEYTISEAQNGGWVSTRGRWYGGGWAIYANVWATLQDGVLTFENKVLIKSSEEVCLRAIAESLFWGGLRNPTGSGLWTPCQYQLSRRPIRLSHMYHTFPPQSPEVVRDIITRVISAQPISTHLVRVYHVTNFREEVESIIEARKNLTHLVCLARSLQKPGTTPSKRDTNLDDLLRPFMLGGITTEALTKLGASCSDPMMLDVGNAVHYGWEDQGGAR